MKHVKRFFAAFLVALLLVSLSTCAPNLAVAAVTPMLEVTAAPTPTLTPEPTEVPMPAVDEYGFTEERKAELNQQIRDFLNYEGEFIREKMSEMMMEPATNLDPREVGLGWAIHKPDGIQGYFFDYFVKDDRLFLLFGFDGKDGNRFVTPVEIQLYVYEQCSEAVFWGFEYTYNDFWGHGGDDTELKYFYGENEIISLLGNLKSKVIVLDLNTDECDQLDVDKYGQVYVDGIKELNSKVELTSALFQLVLSNGIPNDNPKRGDTASIIKIESVNDAENIDIAKVPIILSVSYFKGILDTK